MSTPRRPMPAKPPVGGPTSPPPADEIVRIAQAIARMLAREDYDRENRPAGPMKVAIYARFSSELQDKRSIDDQVALCRDYASRQGWSVAFEPYADYAVSGASVHGRFAFERLILDAKAAKFDVILAEDLDRLSRNQADIAALYEQMSFIEVRLWTVADGEVSEMHIGLKGTMSALFLKALAQKIHRGMAGRVRAGKIPGGLCYGYRVTGRAWDRARAGRCRPPHLQRDDRWMDAT
jgi:DNA invertase Pin-like site-specific DNA recombinase